MGEIVSRVKALGLPLDELVVIGSGLLDAYGLREASDVDLAVSEPLFEQLKKVGGYTLGIKHDDEVLIDNNVEIWRDWVASYEELAKDAVTVDGVRFASPAYIIERKQQRGWDKDLNDIRLLQEYLHEQ